MKKLHLTMAAAVVAAMGLQVTAFATSYAPDAVVDPDDFVLGPTTPGKSGIPIFGTGAAVTWSEMGALVPTEDGPSVALGAVMPAGYKAELVAAFSAWSAVADITFTEIPDDGAPFNAPTGSGDIRVGATPLDGAGGTLAHGYFPPANGLTAAGDIHFDSGDLWKIGFGGPGFDIFQVAAHEIGHAIGLAHTAVPASLMNPFYTEAFSGPQADDIAGGVFIYGAAPAGVPEGGSTLVFLGLVMFGIGAVRRRIA